MKGCHFLSSIHCFSLSLSHTHTHTHARSYFSPSPRDPPGVSEYQHRQAPEQSTEESEAAQSGPEWPEQPSLHKTMEALPLLPQKSRQSPSAGFCSVTTRHDLWAWNEWWDNDAKPLTRLGPLALTGVAAANRSSKSSNAGPFWKRKGWWMRMKWMTHRWHGFMCLMMTLSMVYTLVVTGGGSGCQCAVKTLEYVPSINWWENTCLARKYKP